MPKHPPHPRSLLLLTLLGGLAAAPAAAQGDPTWMRGRIGVHVQPLTPELREHFGGPRDRGLLVAKVEAGRPGARAGLRVGDVLLEADDVPLARPADLVRSVAGVAPGAVLELRVLRDGAERTVKVEPEGDAQPYFRGDAWEGWQRWLDRGLRQGSQELRQRLEELERRLERLEERLDAEEPKKT